MENIQLEINDKGDGAFVLYENKKQIGQMVVSISETELIADHTEIDEAHRGRGLAIKLFEEMVSYARAHHLKVTALCPYVYAQFNRNRALYSDIWNRE